MSTHKLPISEAMNAFFGGGQTEVKGPEITVQTPVKVEPDGDVDFKPVQNAINKEAKQGNVKAKVPVDIELSVTEKELQKQINELRKRVVSWKDYKNKGTIDQSWFDREMRRLKREASDSNEPKALQWTKGNVERASLLNGIINKQYKPRHSIDTSSADLDLIKKILSEEYVNNEIGKWLQTRKSVDRSFHKSAKGLDVGSIVDESTINAEIESINKLKDAVNDVTDAIGNKTSAFENEKNSVIAYVQDEIDALDKLERKVRDDIPGALKQTTQAFADSSGSIAQSNQVQSQRPVARRQTPNLLGNSEYPWNSWDNFSNRKFSTNVLNQKEPPKALSRLINDIIRLTDEGNLDKSATSEALLDFKDTISQLSDTHTFEELYDTILKMRAFNDVVKKLGLEKSPVDDFKQFKIPGVHPVEDQLKRIIAEREKAEEELRAAKEKQQKAEQPTLTITDGDKVMAIKQQELDAQEDINEALQKEEELTQEELEFQSQLRDEMVQTGEAADLLAKRAEKSLEALKAIKDDFVTLEDGTVIATSKTPERYMLDYESGDEIGWDPKNPNPAYAKKHGLSTKRSDSDDAGDKNLLAFNAQLDTANEKITSFNSSVEAASKALSDFAVKSSEHKEESTQNDLNIENVRQLISEYIGVVLDTIAAKKEEAEAAREAARQATEEASASDNLEHAKEEAAQMFKSYRQETIDITPGYDPKFGAILSSMMNKAHREPTHAQVVSQIVQKYKTDNAFDQYAQNAVDLARSTAQHISQAIKDKLSSYIKSFIAAFTPALAQRDGLNGGAVNINFKDAVNAQTQALASDVSAGGFQETLNTLTQLETKLSTDIPAAVQKKTEAFAQELKDVTGYIDKETGVLNRFKDDVKDLLSEDQTRSSTEPSFLESELSGIDALKMALDTDIPTAIDVKNQAFKDERDKVIGWVEEEISALGKLDEAAKGVTPPQSPTASDRIGGSGNGINGGQNNGSLPIKTGGRRSNNWNLPNRISIFDSIDFEDLDDKGNLSKSVIDALTSILRNAKGQLFNYYDKSRQIATGKFDLNQLSRFYHNALPIRDILDNLGDISWFANMQTTNDKGDTEYINKSLHDVYEAFLNERDAVVDTTAKVLEQGSLIGDISNILYDGSKTLVARMNELARYAMDNAGDIHSAYSQTEREEDALAAIRYLSKNAGKHFKNNALAKSGLLKGGPAANLDLENNEWKYNEQLIRPFINNMDSAQDKVRKKLEGLLRGINHIVNDVVPDTIDSAKAKAADLTANSLENNSPMAKAYRAYGRLSKQDGQNGANYYHTLKKFQDNGMLYGVKNADKLPAAEVNKLLDDQKAKLADIEAKRKEELKLIDAISDKELASNEQLLARKRTYDAVEDSAERYAEARFNEAKVKLGQSKYNDSINSIYDAFYRAENFTQKRNTVGITDLEEQELQKAIRNYNELREQLEAIAESSNEAKSALEVLNDKESKASDKLKNKWSDARDRRYGSYLNEGDTKGLYGTRNDVLAGLQRYATREGAKGFQLFDGKAVGNIQKYRAEVESTDGTIEKLNLTLNKTTGELYSVSMGTKQSTSFFEQFSEGLKRRAISLAQYAMTFASLRTAIQAFRAAINNVKDLDSAFVELSRISHDSSAALEEFRKKSFEVADQVGSTAAQVINSAAQWEHLGYNVKEAGELAKVSSIYKNIADGMSSDSEATEDLVSIMKAYDFTAEQAIDVTDALIAVSNNYAVTAADIGNALKRSASAMSVANNTFEQNVALATAMAEVTQNAEKSGSALQVLSLRIRGAKTELQEMGEDTDDMASSTSKLRAQVKGLTKGFDIMKDDKTFKQTYEIMKGIAAVWDDLDDISRASLLETLAGKVRANQVAALLDNFSQAEKVLQTIAEDEGTAIANNEAKLNTIEARITKFRNATQHLTADIFQPELIKTVIDNGTKLVNILDTIIQKTGALTPVMGLLGAATTAKGGGIVGGLWNAYKNSKITKEQPFVNPYANVTVGKAQQSAYNMIAEAEGAKAAREALSDLQDKQIEVLEYMRQNDTGMAQAITALGEAAENSGGLLDVFKAKGIGAFKALGMAALNMVATAAIAFLAQQAIKFVDEIINHTKYLNESAKEFGAQMKQTESEIDSYGEKIAAQKAIIEDHTSSIEDVTEARAELYKIQSDMIAAYGGESESIKTVTDAINGQSDALERNIEALKEQQHQKAIEDFNKANDDWYKSTVRQMSHGTMTDDGQIIPQTITAYEEFMDNMENYKTDLSSLNNILPEKEFQDVINKYKNENNWDDLSSAVGNVNQFVELYDELMDTAKMLRDSNEGGIDQARYDYIQKQLTRLSSPARETSQSNRDLYEQEMLHQIRQNKELNGKYSNLSDLYDKYRKADTAELQQEVYEAYNAAVQQIADDKSLSYGIKQQFMSLYPDLKAEADKWVFELKFKSNEAGLRDEIQHQIDEITKAVGHTVTKEELDHWDDSQHDAVANAVYSNYARTLTQNGISSVQAGNEIASQSGVLTTENLEALKSRIESITGVIQNDLDQTLITAVKDVDGLPQKFAAAYKKVSKNVGTETDRINAALKLVAREAANTAKTTEQELGGMDLSDVAKHLTKLNEVYDKLKKDGEVKWNTINTKDFKESFGDIKDETGEFQKAFDDFHKVLSSTPNDTKAVQDAFDTLASSYVYNSDCMSLLNENNKDLVIGMLSDNGVLNATEVVNEALTRKAEAAQYDAFSENLLAQQGVDLTNVSGESATATLEGAVAFLESAGYAEQDQAAIAKLILEQWALNGSQIDTSGSCSALQDLAAMAGVAAGQIIALNNAMAGGTGGVPAGMSADEWDQVYDKEAYFKHEQERRQQETLEQLRGARERVRLGGGGGGSSSGGGGGGGGGNKEPSKTDKEFDYVNRALQIMQEQNEELREKVDNQYIILQDAEGNAEEFSDAIGRLGEAEQELNSLGVYYGEDEFTEFLKTLDLSDTAETLNDNVGEIEDAYKEVSDIYDDTPGLVHPVGYQDSDTFLGAEIEDYDKVITAAKKYKKALSDVEKAKDKTSKTLDENGTGQLTFIKQLQESDKQLIAAYEHAADSYKTEWEDYKDKILEAFKEDGKGEKYIQDIMFGNLDPEEWERMITYDSNDQTMKDNVELLERGQTAYDHNKESLKSMREWQQKLNDDIQKEYEMRLNIVKAEMTEIESRMNEAQHDLDMKEILGEVVQEADYQRLINISEEQVANYEKQLDVLNEQLGTLDEGEQAWYDCKSQIADCEQNIRECVKQQAEWNDTILRMPVENISRFLKLVQNLGQTLKNWLSVNDAKGIAQNAEQIQTSWTTAYDQIADDELGLMKQLEDYEELLENYDLGSTKFSEVDDEIQSARDSVEQLVEEMIELNKQLLTIPIDKLSEMTTYLDGTLSDLQSIQSEYETTINTVIDLITKQQEDLEEEYNELEKSIEDQIKPLQDQLDLLGKQNDQRDRELAIENALFELEKAREQKTVQVIRDGRVQYEVDESAVRNAQQGYDDALYNKLTGDLQDKIDDLNDQLEKARESTDDQVEALEDMKKNRWETIIPDTERARNEEIATQVFTDLFGATNWKELVLAGQDARGVFADEAIYQGMRQSYGTNSEQQRDTQRQIDINNIITESLTRLVEDFQADKINSEELSAKVSTLMNFVNDGLITGQERLENTLSLGDYSNLGAALTDASRQRNDQMDIFNENLAIAQDNRDQVNELIGRWDDFKVWYDETYKQLYEQYKAIDFIGDTVAKWREDDDDDDDDGNYSWSGPSNHWEEDHYYGGSGDHETGYVTFHDGLEKGSIGGMTPSDKFKAIQALGLKKLSPDEFPAILHLGEGVINQRQQSTMLDNMRQALALGGAGGSSVIQMSFGDITLPSVTNGQDFAESLATQFQPAMNQVFSKIFRR